MIRQHLHFSSAVIAVTLALLPTISFAAGIQVSPSRLEIAVPPGKTIQKDLVVANPTADVQLFSVYADDFDQYIKPQPASFTLEAGGRKNVSLTLQSPDSGTISTTISVVGRPMVDARLQANTGVKIPITITTGQQRGLPNWAWIILGILAIGIMRIVARGARNS